MRHRKKGRKLGRTASHRQALRRNLAAALLRRERIITTVGKAKTTVCFGEIQLDSDCLLIGFYRILVEAKLAVGKAKIIVCHG